MFKWIKNIIKQNTTLLLKPEWIVEDKKPSKKKKSAKKKTAKKKTKKRVRYGKWEGNL